MIIKNKMSKYNYRSINSSSKINFAKNYELSVDCFIKTIVFEIISSASMDLPFHVKY